MPIIGVYKLHLGVLVLSEIQSGWSKIDLEVTAVSDFHQI